MLEKRRRSQRLTGSEARAIREKGDQLVTLFAELDRREMLRPTDEVDLKSIGNVLRNFEEVNLLNATLLKLYKGSRESDRTRAAVPFRDDGGTRYSISMKQLVIQWGWAYCSLCEVMKTLMTALVRFPTKPGGIGEVILALQRAGGLDLSYFDFVEPGVRNAFFHLDFCHDRGDIMIAGRWEPLKVADLVESATRTDSVIYPIIAMLQLFFVKKD